MTDPQPQPRWRISSYSCNGGTCVEVADIDTSVLIRNSNHPDRGTLTFPPDAMAAFIHACADGGFDDHA